MYGWVHFGYENPIDGSITYTDWGSSDLIMISMVFSGKGNNDLSDATKNSLIKGIDSDKKFSKNLEDFSSLGSDGNYLIRENKLFNTGTGKNMDSELENSYKQRVSWWYETGSPDTISDKYNVNHKSAWQAIISAMEFEGLYLKKKDIDYDADKDIATYKKWTCKKSKLQI